MRQKTAQFVTGHFQHRRTEGDSLRVLLDAVSLDDWREVISATLDAAKAGDPGARAWLAHYLVGKPGNSAPTPLTVVVQQLSGRDPLIDQLAAPHINRLEYPALHMGDERKEALKAHVAKEVRELEAPGPETTRDESVG